jgi:small subunit ribosomal protein S20
MANHSSAKKRIRQTARRTEVNRARMSRVRSFVRKVEEAIASGDKEQATAALRDVQPELMRGASRNLLHRNVVARRMSRLSKRIKAMSA